MDTIFPIARAFLSWLPLIILFTLPFFLGQLIIKAILPNYRAINEDLAVRITGAKYKLNRIVGETNKPSFNKPS